MVDVHARRAFTVAREAAETAQFAEQIARLGRRLRDEGDEMGAFLNAILAGNLQLQVADQLAQVRACSSEARLGPEDEDDDEPEGAEVEIPGPWTL